METPNYVLDIYLKVPKWRLLVDKRLILACGRIIHNSVSDTFLFPCSLRLSCHYFRLLEMLDYTVFIIKRVTIPQKMYRVEHKIVNLNRKSPK